jgi:hypothetical protein
MVARKSMFNFFDLKLYFFSTYFDQKHLKNTLGAMTSKNKNKNHPKNCINSKPKIKLGLDLFFQGKTILNMNSPHQMEPFNTNINCFGGLYRCQ